MKNKLYIAIEPNDETKIGLDELSSQIFGLFNDYLFKNHHLTLDFIGNSDLFSSIDKLCSIGRIDDSLLKDFSSIKMGEIKTFVSNSSGKVVFYIDIIGGNKFFSFLRLNGYSIQIPHVTLYKGDLNIGNSEIKKIISELNVSKKLIESKISNFGFEFNKIYLKNNIEKGKVKVVRILEILEL